MTKPQRVAQATRDVGDIMREVGQAARRRPRARARPGRAEERGVALGRRRAAYGDAKSSAPMPTTSPRRSRRGGPAPSSTGSARRTRVAAIARASRRSPRCPIRSAPCSRAGRGPTASSSSACACPRRVTIYESRPNVTADAGALKAGNAAILRGGSESHHSSGHPRLPRLGLAAAKLPAAAIQLVPVTDREAVGLMLEASTARSTSSCRAAARASSSACRRRRACRCSRIWRASATRRQGRRPRHGETHRAQRQAAPHRRAGRPSACSSTATPARIGPLVRALLDAGCEVRGDATAQRADARVKPAAPDDFGREFLDAIIAVRVVEGVDEAIAHIARYGSQHTDCIVTECLGTRSGSCAGGQRHRPAQRLDPVRRRRRVRHGRGDRHRHRQAARARARRRRAADELQVRGARRRPGAAGVIQRPPRPEPSRKPRLAAAIRDLPVGRCGIRSPPLRRARPRLCASSAPAGDARRGFAAFVRAWRVSHPNHRARPDAPRPLRDSLRAHAPLAFAGQRVGLMGLVQSAAAHLLVAETALKRLGLDQLWWMVTPAIRSSRAATSHRSQRASPPVASSRATRRSASPDLRPALYRRYGDKSRERYSGTRFVLVLGADSFGRTASLAPLARAYPRRAHCGRSPRLAARLACPHRGAYAGAVPPARDRRARLACHTPPAWVFLTNPLSPLSSTKSVAASHRNWRRAATPEWTGQKATGSKAVEPPEERA